MLSITKARPADLNEIWSLVSATIQLMNAAGNDQWGADYPQRTDYENALTQGQLYAAREENQNETGPILGVAVLNMEEDPEYAALSGWQTQQPAVVIHKLAVSPAARRQGIATAFFRHGETLGAEWGARSVRVDTYTRNRPMLALLNREGFRFVGEVFFPGRDLPFLVHEKSLNAPRFVDRFLPIV